MGAELRKRKMLRNQSTTGSAEMSSMFLRKTIATLIGVGAFFQAGDSLGSNIPGINVYCTSPECYEQKPIDPPDEPPGEGPDPGGGGGGSEPECPQPPGGNSLLPSLKSLSCPSDRSCPELLADKDPSCDSRVARARGWEFGRDVFDRAGTPMARLFAMANSGRTVSQAHLDPAVRDALRLALQRFNEAGPFADLDESRRSLSTAVAAACEAQRQQSSWGFDAAWRDCAAVEVDVHRESLDDMGFLAHFLDMLRANGFNVPDASYRGVGWTPAANSLRAHFDKLEKHNACAVWWEEVDRLGCK